MMKGGIICGPAFFEISAVRETAILPTNARAQKVAIFQTFSAKIGLTS
jgi:hypothetical protein